MLRMAAFEVRYPITDLVAVKAHDSSTRARPEFGRASSELLNGPLMALVTEPGTRLAVGHPEWSVTGLRRRTNGLHQGHREEGTLLLELGGVLDGLAKQCPNGDRPATFLDSLPHERLLGRLATLDPAAGQKHAIGSFDDRDTARVVSDNTIDGRAGSPG